MSKQPVTEFQRVTHLMGVPFDVTRDIAGALSALLQVKQLTKVFTPNPEILMKTLTVEGYREVLASADVSLPDGNGLFWATTFLHEAAGKGKWATCMIFLNTYARLFLNRASLKKMVPRLHHGSDTFFALHELWNKGSSPRVFYFGGEYQVPDQIVPVMHNRFPAVNIVGNCGGYPFRSNTEYEQILQTIETAKPEVVFVALPFPKQEQWVAKTQERLEQAGVRLVMVCGGTFDFAVGAKKRAPHWMRRFGLEWLWRLVQEPARVGRIWTAVISFPLTILRRRLAGKQDLAR